MPCSSPSYLIFFLLLLFCFPGWCYSCVLRSLELGWGGGGGVVCVCLFVPCLSVRHPCVVVCRPPPPHCYFALGFFWLFVGVFFQGDSFQVLHVFVACHLVPLPPVFFAVLLWAALFSCFVVVSNFLTRKRIFFEHCLHFVRLNQNWTVPGGTRLSVSWHA